MFGLWDRYVVPPLISCACATKPIMKQREKIVPEAEGVVLEIGCGSGTNFDLYDPSKVKHLHAIEPAEGMVKRARETWSDAQRDTPCDIHCCGAEAVPLDDKSVDTAVVTFVLCIGMVSRRFRRRFDGRLHARAHRADDDRQRHPPTHGQE